MNKNMSEQVIMLPLDNVVEIAGIPDRPLDTEYVATLVATNEPDKWPPIIVTPIGSQYGRIAGKHRIAAAKELHRHALSAVVRSYSSQVEMYAAMWEDNVKNGLPLTTWQRKQYAVTLWRSQPSLTLRELGRRAGLPHQTVKVAIEEAKNPPASDESQGGYTREVDYTKRLITSLNQFFQNERAIFGSVDGKRSESARAKVLASKISANASTIALMQSLSRTFNETATLLARKAEG